MVVACYTAGGFTFGTVTAGAGTPAVIIGCNVALGTCMTGCAALLITPTPWSFFVYIKLLFIFYIYFITNTLFVSI